MAEKQEKKEKSEKPKVAKVVALRNRFFFMLYRNSALVFLTSLIGFAFSVLFLVLFAKQPVPPQYIPINEDGTLIKLTPLSECKDDSEVQKFTTSAINKLFKYDYINYADQLQSAASYFTTDGWNEYLDQFKNANQLLAVKENRWVVTVQPNSVPIITKKWVENNTCMWEVKTTVSMMYIGNSSQNPKGDIYMRLRRQSVISNADGLGITKLVFAESK